MMLHQSCIIATSMLHHCYIDAAPLHFAMMQHRCHLATMLHRCKIFNFFKFSKCSNLSKLWSFIKKYKKMQWCSIVAASMQHHCNIDAALSLVFLRIHHWQTQRCCIIAAAMLHRCAQMHLYMTNMPDWYRGGSKGAGRVERSRPGRGCKVVWSYWQEPL